MSVERVIGEMYGIGREVLTFVFGNDDLVLKTIITLQIRGTGKMPGKGFFSLSLTIGGRHHQK